MPDLAVASFYRFADVDNLDGAKTDILSACETRGLLGTVLLAAEGVNGSLAGSRAATAEALQAIARILGLREPLDARWTAASEPPFRRLKVRVKAEIVTLGRPDLQPHRRTGRHVSPEEWNQLISDPGTLVIDTRNDYEVEVGTFPGAIDPGTQSFREFPDFVSALSESERQRPVAMFCTGGIRCEKASALMLDAGFENVMQLDGGILSYLDNVADDANAWDGECFVFDTRVAIDKDLAEGGYVQCHACRRPLSQEDLSSPDYREGVACPRCVGSADDKRRARLEERRRQVRLARERGKKHIGA